MHNVDILFYQLQSSMYFGITSLATYLKKDGFSSDVLIESMEDSPFELMKEINPKIIGISCLSTEHNWLVDTCKKIKEVLPDVMILVGGIHAILYYNEIISESVADLVCHSEGEEVLVHVLNELKKKEQNWRDIPGLVFRDESGGIVVNERAELIKYSDDILEEKEIYYKRYPSLFKDAVFNFLSSRGCPYRCSFCYNSTIHDVFKGKGKYLRQKSVDNFINEILYQSRKYKIKKIHFIDDLLTYNKKWTLDFFHRYKEEIAIPFICTTRANLIDEDVAQALKSAGCCLISYGLETGNPEIRKNVLKKNISNEQIISCGNILKKQGLTIHTTNIFCLPGETIEDSFETVLLNQKAKTDHATAFIYMPFPGTELADYCINKGLLREDYNLKHMPTSYSRAKSMLKIKDKAKCSNVHDFTWFFVRYPWTYKLFRNFAKIGFLGPLYNSVYNLGDVLQHKQTRDMTALDLFRFFYRKVKSRLKINKK